MEMYFIAYFHDDVIHFTIDLDYFIHKGMPEFPKLCVGNLAFLSLISSTIKLRPENMVCVVSFV